MAPRPCRNLLLRIAPSGIYRFVCALHKTIRWTELNMDLARSLWAQGQGMIVAFWHGRMLMAPFFYRGRGLKILISHHVDGELICRVMARFGFQSVRGSTRRGGIEAFRELVRTCQSGWDVAITPDGPRGPRYVVQKGVIELARKTGFPIVPATFSAERRIHLPSWDAFMIPYPFTRGVVVCGRPLWVAPGAEADRRTGYRRELQERLRLLTERADAYFEGHGDSV